MIFVECLHHAEETAVPCRVTAVSSLSRINCHMHINDVFIQSE